MDQDARVDDVLGVLRRRLIDTGHAVRTAEDRRDVRAAAAALAEFETVLMEFTAELMLAVNGETDWSR